jgi:hypothetical protein
MEEAVAIVIVIEIAEAEFGIDRKVVFILGCVKAVTG